MLTLLIAIFVLVCWPLRWNTPQDQQVRHSLAGCGPAVRPSMQ